MSETAINTPYLEIARKITVIKRFTELGETTSPNLQIAEAHKILDQRRESVIRFGGLCIIVLKDPKVAELALKESEEKDGVRRTELCTTSIGGFSGNVDLVVKSGSLTPEVSLNLTTAGNIAGSKVVSSNYSDFQAKIHEVFPLEKPDHWSFKRENFAGEPGYSRASYRFTGTKDLVPTDFGIYPTLFEDFVNSSYKNVGQTFREIICQINILTIPEKKAAQLRDLITACDQASELVEKALVP